MSDFIELLAVVTSATYGVLLARQHQMDFVGVFSVAFVTAFGGGTLRDLFLDRHPLFWIREDHYPVIVFGIALTTSVVPKIPSWLEKILDVPDAFGLGLFTIAGASAAIAAGTSLFNAALMGVVTGTFGGVIGDVICNRVPNLFRTAPMYATCSFAGCWLLFGLKWLQIPLSVAVPSAIVFIVTFRLVALRYGWRLPVHNDGPPTSD